MKTVPWSYTALTVEFGAPTTMCVNVSEMATLAPKS